MAGSTTPGDAAPRDARRERALLLARLQEHLTLIRSAAMENEFVDLPLAEELHGRLGAVVQSSAALDDDERRILIDAVAYLVRIDDEEDDLRSPIGFDDDAAIIESALSRLRG